MPNVLAPKSGKKGNRIKITALLSGRVRSGQMEGRDYWVVPVTMIMEGVHAGSGGPAYYSEQTLVRHDPGWDHKPIVVYHPQKQDGTNISAANPAVLTSSKVGVLLKTRTMDGKTRSEAWIEKDRAKKVDPRIEQALRKGIVMEVSTGLYATGVRRKRGTWNGEKYEFEVKSFAPDHLALLPDQIGACSVADGCGLLQFNKRIKFNKARKLQSAFDELYAADFHKENSTMCKILEKKKTLVNALVKTGEWTKEDRPFLMKQDVERLKKFQTLATPDEEDEDDAEEEGDDAERTAKARREKLRKQRLANKKAKAAKEAAEDDADGDDGETDDEKPPVGNKSEKVGKKAKESKPETVEEFLAKAPAQIRDLLAQSLADTEARKDEMILDLLDNEANIFSEAQLEKMDFATLKGLHALSAGKADPDDDDEEDAHAGVVNFVGRAGRHTHNRKEETDEEPLELPQMFAKKDDKKAS